VLSLCIGSVIKSLFDSWPYLTDVSGGDIGFGIDLNGSEFSCLLFQGPF
jgi:hypothetical protein